MPFQCPDNFIDSGLGQYNLSSLPSSYILHTDGLHRARVTDFVIDYLIARIQHITQRIVAIHPHLSLY